MIIILLAMWNHHHPSCHMMELTLSVLSFVPREVGAPQTLKDKSLQGEKVLKTVWQLLWPPLKLGGP